MTGLLLSEQAPKEAHILVLGAGGGLELAALAEARPHWQFTGVDPSRAMLDLAHQATERFANRIVLLEGTVDVTPLELFDGATCLLVLHFLDWSERLETLRKIRRRLRDGAGIVIAHHAPPADKRQTWLARSVAFGNRSEWDWERANESGKTISERLPLLAPSAEEDLLRQAGFGDVEMFYAAFSFRGWVGTAR